jgi:hypothetical protein
MVYSQIWLNLLLDDSQITKSKKNPGDDPLTFSMSIQGPDFRSSLLLTKLGI